MFKGIIEYSHYLLKKSVSKGETVIDATCGNGNDTLFLSELVGKDGKVLSFDIQEKAINRTKKKLHEQNVENVRLILDDHANMNHYLSMDQVEKIGGAIFNLGYLPGSDKKVITNPKTTIAALDTILLYLKKKGIVVLVVYHGHEGGKKEKEGLLKHVIQLDQKKYNVLQYRFINQINHPPFIIAIQKK